jgi:hypothetical protein
MISSLDRNTDFMHTTMNNTAGDRSKCNLIVNYLPQLFTENDFCRLFEQIGPIKTYKLMSNKQTGIFDIQSWGKSWDG